MLTATCRTCGAAKEPSDYSTPDCTACKTLRTAAEKQFAEANPDATGSEILYVGRTALNQRAHHANKNFVDPRSFAAVRGVIPIPPQGNVQDRPV